MNFWKRFAVTPDPQLTAASLLGVAMALAGGYSWVSIVQNGWAGRVR